MRATAARWPWLFPESVCTAPTSVERRYTARKLPLLASELLAELSDVPPTLLFLLSKRTRKNAEKWQAGEIVTKDQAR